MANAFADPSVGRRQQVTPGAGALSSTQNLNPAQWTGNTQQKVAPSWGAPTQPQQGYYTQPQFNQQNNPWWWLNQPPTQGRQLGVQNEQGISSDGGSYEYGGYQGQGADLSPQGYQDYFSQGRGVAQGLSGMFGLPITTMTDYNMGFNTFSPNSSENMGFNNPLTGNYTSFYNQNYQGPGSTEYQNMNPSEQRDMMINQFGYDTRGQEDESFLEGLFGGGFFGNQLNYDPDQDLGLDDFGNPQDPDDWVDWNDPDDFDDDDFEDGFPGDDGWGDTESDSDFFGGDAESDMDGDSGWSGADSDFDGDGGGWGDW